MTKQEALHGIEEEISYLTARIGQIETTIFQLETEQREMQEKVKFLKLKMRDLQKVRN